MLELGYAMYRMLLLACRRTLAGGGYVYTLLIGSVLWDLVLIRVLLLYDR